KTPSDEQEHLASGLVHLRAKIHLAVRTDLHGGFFPYGNVRDEVIAFVNGECLEHASRLDDVADMTAVHTDERWSRAARLTATLYATLREGIRNDDDERAFQRMLETADALALSAVEIVLPLVGGSVRGATV